MSILKKKYVALSVVLEMGGSDEPMDLYRRFRGADPDPTALTRARGL